MSNSTDTVAATSTVEATTPPQVPINVPTRERLPDTRRSITHRFTIDGHKAYVTVGLYSDGRPGEVFVRMAKEGSTLSGLMDTIAVLTSLALQYHVPLEALVSKFEKTRFEPAGWTGHPELSHATSIVDYIFRWLRLQFPGTDPDIQTGSGENIAADGQEAL